MAHQNDGDAPNTIPESERVTLAEYMADSSAILDRALDREVIVVKPNGQIAMILAGRVELLE